MDEHCGIGSPVLHRWFPISAHLAEPSLMAVQHCVDVCSVALLAFAPFAKTRQMLMAM